MAQAIGQMMDGTWADDDIAALLLALNEKGPSVDEIAGAATAMRSHMIQINAPCEKFIDTCGTGGDRSGTFNISTATALVIAAAGVTVAKHGNRSVTSKSGSADVLSRLGVNIEADVATIEKSLEEVGICFCFAPLMHGSMKHVAPVRKKLGVPTIFNLLGPLCNPANAPYQLLGVGKPEYRELLASALQKLGTTRAVFVTGRDGMDEVTISDATDVIIATENGLVPIIWQPEEFGIERQGKEDMLVDGPEESAAMIRGVLSGTPGAARDIVVINAAAALWTIGENDSLSECARLAQNAIDSGAAEEKLAKLAEVSHS
ncbi:anthranilate phosphoribosyltransferase [Blastopirellula marina]|uniref:Anthranilate phosphoribosyltransferase n=2 Tax=Blastopirellula marina TaxID=124 RepID=A0A2S8F8A7_9BACT|nr:anthranilate phosphoribosyltransferase [Blastopirellula marina]PTL41936.1 anthranilate phosphoribosyltransferase [Blastopirellula marina]